MDFRRLSSMLPAPNATGNATSVTNLPPTLFEALIPGYSIYSRYALEYFGLDISLFVTGIALFLAFSKGGRYLLDQIDSWFYQYCTSTVYIDEYDDLFDMLTSWLADHHKDAATRNRRMQAVTQYGSRSDDPDEEMTKDALDESGLFNFSRWSARTPPRYEHYYGRQWFWHNGRIFWFKRQRRDTQRNVQVVQMMGGGPQRDDQISVDCIGRSITPIKEFLRAVRVCSSNQTSNTTVIRHPRPKNEGRFGGGWARTLSRPSRPMDTVILDDKQKRKIIRDMNSFLLPSTPRWYATRGIPYRRGYLFHGPPGTGKTSLSFALAGIFGLGIYAISLQDPTISESDLMQLFNYLPSRCIVLLEDVDAAGLTRDASSDDTEKKKTKKKGDKEKNGKTKEEETKAGKKNGKKAEEKTGTQKKDDEFTLKDLAQAIVSLKGNDSPPVQKDKKPRMRMRTKSSAETAGNATNGDSGISLSGLLNAIDGVASHEGRVLIMTTNHPEKLDHALVRPGRVDLKIEFALAAREQLRELFSRMYTASDERPELVEPFKGRRTDAHVKPSANGTVDPFRASAAAAIQGTDDEDELATMSREQLEELAVEFAGKIPDDTLTPAEVQNLLMQHKREPSKAVGRVESWIKELLEEKEKQWAAKAKESSDESEAESDDE